MMKTMELQMVLSRVPPEIWLQIIREATYIPPGVCEAKSPDPLSPYGTDIPSSQAAMLCREVLQTKFAISLISKTWNSFCAGFLYEFIVVSDVSHISLLLRQFLRTPELATHVQRINFECGAPPRGMRVVGRNGVAYNSVWLALSAARILCLCPNLRVLSFKSTLWEGDPFVLTKALKRIGKNLECLECYSSAAITFPLIMTLLKTPLPRLRELLVYSKTRISPRPVYIPLYGAVDDDDSDEFDAEDDGLRAETNIINVGDSDLWMFPLLHTLRWEYYEWWVPDHNFTPPPLSSLRHIVVDESASHLALFRYLHRTPQVSALTFSRKEFSKACSFAPDFILPPSVHTLVFYLDELPISPFQLPYVERIGLKGTNAPSPEDYDFAFGILVGGDSSAFPCLKLIRLLDVPLARTLKDRQMQFTLWERRCRDKGVRLEDEGGQIMTPTRLQ